ncbi:MAG: FAD-dependent oxidoreductase [Candidatus Thiodiazotropha sp. (ex Myrtea sp. 'scaly one' KF741663)]|nr:FAD-dependent oxidoreductase [Candidatus Thiodiazotropha sp. (ex Myrtea sp. 'scaly one' KF741663)]
MGSVSASPVSTQVDVAIFGGGIAGLWLLARLRQAGYSAILLEPNGLGGVQTLASQGIIHGGTKYALTGKLTGSSQAIKAMPGIWRDCLAGEGELDLSRVRTLSDHQFLWSTSGLISRMAGFFAGKVMESRVREVKENDRPAAFRNPGFKGTVYRLDEPVLDVASLVSELSRQFGDSAYKLNWPDGLRFDHARRFSLLGPDGAWQTLETKQTVFTAGAGNEALLKCLGRDKPTMQKRPLQMVMLKGDLPPLYAHCLGASANPRLTVTSYPLAGDKTLWYLGGDVAEQGVGRNQEEQIAAAKRELNQLLPWVDLQKVAWGTLNVDRAEPRQSDGQRPESSFLQAHDGLIVAWPTKLAFAPRLAEQVIAGLSEAGIPPTSESTNVSLSIALAQAAIPPWEKEHLWI